MFLVSNPLSIELLMQFVAAASVVAAVVVGSLLCLLGFGFGWTANNTHSILCVMYSALDKTMETISMSPIKSTYTKSYEKRKQFRLKQLYTFDPKAAATEHTNVSQTSNTKDEHKRNDENSRKSISISLSSSRKNSRTIVKVSFFYSVLSLLAGIQDLYICFKTLNGIS